MPVQTRSQTRIANVHVNNTDAHVNNTDVHVNNTESIRIDSINKLYPTCSNNNTIVATVQSYLKQINSTSDRVEKKTMGLQMYSYLCSSKCNWFLKKNTRFMITIMQKLIEFKKKNHFTEWEADDFLSKLKNMQTDDIRIAWDAVCNNTPIIWNFN